MPGYARRPRYMVVALDCLAVLLCSVAAASIANRTRMPLGGFHTFLVIRLKVANAAFLGAFVLLWIKCLDLFGLYEPRSLTLSGLLLRTGAATVAMGGILTGYLLYLHNSGPVFTICGLFFCGTSLYLIVRTASLKGWTKLGRAANHKVVIFGTGRHAQKAWKELRVNYHKGMTLLGFVDDCSTADMAPDIRARCLGTAADLEYFLTYNSIDELIIATSLPSCFDRAREIVALAESYGVKVLCLKDIYDLGHHTPQRRHAEIFTELVPSDEELALWLLVKTAVDRLVASVALFVLSPLILSIFVLLRLAQSEPAFIREKRYGLHRRPFFMLSFTTSPFAAGSTPELLRKSGRGAFDLLPTLLKMTSLHKLPSLWNVLTGDMSLVGPRPMPFNNSGAPLEPSLASVFSVRPGITGPWRGVAPGKPGRPFEVDRAYVDKWSFFLDMKLLSRSLVRVARGYTSMPSN